MFHCLFEKESCPLAARFFYWLHRTRTFAFAAIIASFVQLLCTPSVQAESRERPNIVLIFADDLGYGDLSCFGSKTIRSPNIDALAEQGTRFTQFYVTQAVCSASRASLMTGCYANRVGMEGALNHTSPQGINPEELLLPEMLKQHGYTNAIFGKWHLGLSPYYSPLRNGFDEYLGIPYSNDNTKYHPSLANEMPPLPLYDGDEIVESDPDQSLFTKRFTERAVNFIHQNRDKPFFLYVPHVMPHVPIFASKDFRDRTKHGLYADVVEELDWSVGEILKAIDEMNLGEKTLVIFTSDNGPFLSYGTHAGTTGGLREGKLTSYEGGLRVPCVMRWPGKIPAKRICNEPLVTMDLMPTIASWLDASLADKPIDGKNISDCLFDENGSKSPHDQLLFYSGSELQAVRQGKWKLHFRHPYITVDGEPGTGGKPAGYGRLQPKSITLSGVAGIASRHGYRIEQQPLALYDLDIDPAESNDVSKENPEAVHSLSEIAAMARQSLGDSLTGTKGSQIRPCGDNRSSASVNP